MKNLIYLGLGGLVVYLYLKNRKDKIAENIDPVQKAGKIARQAVENSRFSIPDLSDKKQYQQDLKMCK
jgi:hypothetical protein